MSRLTLSLVFVAGCTVQSNPPPQYPPPAPQEPPPPVAAPAPAPTDPAPAPPPPVAQPAPPPVLDASAPCIDGTGDVSNEFDGAVALTVPSTTVVCSGKRDVDVFAITAPGTTGASLITYDVKQLTDDQHASKIELFDANRKAEHRNAGRRSEHIRGWAVLQAGTTMFVKFSQVHSDEGKFAITWTVAPIEDGNEPDDTRETAKTLGNGTASGLSYRALNNNDATSDWYTVEVAKPGPVTVALDAAENIAIKGTAFDGNRKRVGGKHGGRGERIEWSFKAKSAGTYAIEVSSIHRIETAGRDDV
ncbi:MAG: hypothetical protein AB7L94_43755, partial [Kofleriaceae bacterium]